jgi:hypothetical protein
MSKLKDKLCSVDMNDPQALSKMICIIEDVRYKYEMVKGMTVGDVVNEHCNKGSQFYIAKKDQRVNFEKLDVFTLCNWLNRGEIGRKVPIGVEEIKFL